MSTPAKSSPKDAQVMSAILKDMGVLESEPRLINQMLEFTYRYVTDILEEAKVYSNHANRKSVDTDDVKLAVQMKMDHSFTTPPPRDMLMDIARQKNCQPLPLVKPYCGPRLPPDRYCLTAPNYKLKTLKKPRTVQYGLPMSQRIGLGPQVKTLGGPTLAVVTKTLTQPTVTILNKPQAVPKPTVRVNPGIGVGGIGASGLSRIISTSGVSLTQSSNAGLTLTQPSSTNVTLNQASSSLPSSAGVSLTQASVTSMLTSMSTATPTTLSMTVNPLKRKLEDDDYDI